MAPTDGRSINGSKVAGELCEIGWADSADSIGVKRVEKEGSNGLETL